MQTAENANTRTEVAMGGCKQILSYSSRCMRNRQTSVYSANLSSPTGSNPQSLPLFLSISLCIATFIDVFLLHLSSALPSYKVYHDLFPLPSKTLSTVDTDLCVSNLPVEDLIQDDEAIGRVRWIPFDQHIGRLGCHYLVGHSAWDVICLVC